MMDLSDLYTPEELAGQRISFLTRLLTMFDDSSNPFDLGRSLAHKIHGTGGNLGIDGLLEAAPHLHGLAREGKDEQKVTALLGQLRRKIEMQIDVYRKDLP